MEKLSKNFFSNLMTKFWSLIAIYLFIPLYIKILGEESYGIVSFFATMQSAINLLGLGLSNTLRREFAVSSSSLENDNIRRKKLICSIESIYLVIGIIVSLVCFCFSGTIANKWLNIGDLQPSYVGMVISLMGISISIQIITNLYSGCLFGLDLQGLANILCIAWSVTKYCGSLAIIGLINPDLRLFYVWHVLIDILYLIVLRITISFKIKTKHKTKRSFNDFRELGNIWKYALGIFAISIIALVNKQLDKIIISGTLSLTELGAYNLATTLGSLTTIFSSAMYISVFPSFTKALSLGNKENVTLKYVNVNRFVNSLTGCVGAFIAFYSVPLINLWTRSNSYDLLLNSAAPMVVLAVMMSELQQIPYALVLANGNTKINTIIGLVYLPFVCVFTWVGIHLAGLFGAGVVYLLVMGSQTIIYQYIVAKKYVTSQPLFLILRDLILPTALASITAFITHFIIMSLSLPNFAIVFFAVLFGSITFFFELFFLNKDYLRAILKKLKKRGSFNE